MTAYPALVDEADSVAVRVFESEAEQARAMTTGTRRLLLLEVPTPVPVLSRRLSNQVKLGLTRYPYAKVPDLLEDCVSAAVDSIVARHGGPAFDDAGYAALREAARVELPDTTAQVVVAVEKVVAAAHDARAALAAPASPVPKESIEDMRAQLFALIKPGFVTATGLAAPGRSAAIPAGHWAAAGEIAGPTRPGTGRGWNRCMRCARSTRTCSGRCRHTRARPPRWPRSDG